MDLIQALRESDYNSAEYIDQNLMYAVVDGTPEKPDTFQISVGRVGFSPNEQVWNLTLQEVLSHPLLLHTEEEKWEPIGESEY